MQGPIGGVRRIWADGELIFDANNVDLNAIAVSTPLGAMTIYPGDEAQFPDGTIEAYQGVGNVPRPSRYGLCGIHRRRRDEVGRIPNLEIRGALVRDDLDPSRVAVSSAAVTHQATTKTVCTTRRARRSSRVAGRAAPSTSMDPAGALISSVTKNEHYYFPLYSLGGITGVQGERPGLCYNFTSPPWVVYGSRETGRTKPLTGRRCRCTTSAAATVRPSISRKSGRLLDRVPDRRRRCGSSSESGTRRTDLRSRVRSKRSRLRRTSTTSARSRSARAGRSTSSSFNPQSSTLAQGVWKYDTSGALVDSWALTGSARS